MSVPLARPKRAGDEFARTNHLDDDDVDGPSSSKKPRFDLRNPTELAPDAVDEDTVLELDEIGRRGQQARARRREVNIDGYESDSDNDAFDARAEAKARRNKEKDAAENDDMFAELEEDFKEDQDEEATRKDKKTVRFLRDDEIEGQVASSRGGRSVRADLSKKGEEALREMEEEDDEDSESDVPDEERARIDDGMDKELGAGAKKKHAPLLDAFNMKAEQEEGRFDEHGNYVRKAADPDAIHDSWLEGISKKDMKRAREAAAQREAARRERDKEDDKILTADLLRTLITHLERGETVLEALARLGKGLRKKPKWQTKHRNKKRNGEQDVEMAEVDPTEAARKQAIEAITGAADMLLTRGQPDIYEASRELLTRQFRRETGEEWVDPVPADSANGGAGNAAQGPTMWEFRWSDGRDGGETHGPYDSAMMESWRDAGYFGEGVEFRRVGDTNGWTRVANFS